MKPDDSWKDIIENAIGATTYQYIALPGGDINRAYSFLSDSHRYFMKYQIGIKAHQLLYKESIGLDKIRSTKTILTPSPIYHTKFTNGSGLIMPYIESGKTDATFWRQFGQKIAALHSISSSHFGLEEDNFIGTITQINTVEQSWASFYATHRILPLVKNAIDQGMLDKEIQRKADTFCYKLRDIFPVEPPALLHGDLWAGNFICDDSNNPVLIDPAVYFGHREMDLAMSKLFGGFNNQFYDSYMSAFPLVSGWQNRLKFCQLYYLLVHLILFGMSYKKRVTDILTQF